MVPHLSRSEDSPCPSVPRARNLPLGERAEVRTSTARTAPHPHPSPSESTQSLSHSTTIWNAPTMCQAPSRVLPHGGGAEGGLEGRGIMNREGERDGGREGERTARGRGWKADLRSLGKWVHLHPEGTPGLPAAPVGPGLEVPEFGCPHPAALPGQESLKGHTHGEVGTAGAHRLQDACLEQLLCHMFHVKEARKLWPRDRANESWGQGA